MTRQSFAFAVTLALATVALVGCATSADTEAMPHFDTGKSDGAGDGIVEDSSRTDSTGTDSTVTDTSASDTGADTGGGDDTAIVDDTSPPPPDVITIDAGGSCGASTCGKGESCCPYTLTCYASGCLSCCSPKLDAGFDTPTFDTGDKCALVKCASGLICCPSTGACYSKLCLACCPSPI